MFEAPPDPEFNPQGQHIQVWSVFDQQVGTVTMGILDIHVITL